MGSLTSIAEVSNVEDGWCSGGVGSRQQDMLQSHTRVLTQSPVSNEQEPLRGSCTCQHMHHLVSTQQGSLMEFNYACQYSLYNS